MVLPILEDIVFPYHFASGWYWNINSWGFGCKCCSFHQE